MIGSSAEKGAHPRRSRDAARGVRGPVTNEGQFLDVIIESAEQHDPAARAPEPATPLL
jgi:hypothetical protein